MPAVVIRDPVCAEAQVLQLQGTIEQLRPGDIQKYRVARRSRLRYVPAVDAPKRITREPSGKAAWAGKQGECKVVTMSGNTTLLSSVILSEAKNLALTDSH